jgi:hypothetical protein
MFADDGTFPLVSVEIATANSGGPFVTIQKQFEHEQACDPLRHGGQSLGEKKIIRQQHLEQRPPGQPSPQKRVKTAL